jgi:hypothetical protein
MMPSDLEPSCVKPVSKRSSLLTAHSGHWSTIWGGLAVVRYICCAGRAGEKYHCLDGLAGLVRDLHTRAAL